LCTQFVPFVVLPLANQKNKISFILWHISEAIFCKNSPIKRKVNFKLLPDIHVDIVRYMSAGEKNYGSKK
jgi:hypothetical protein